jgi:hypothetical protein
MQVITDSANGLPFDETYWKKMYAEAEDSIIDGVVNAEQHANYIKSVLSLQGVKVTSIGDFGFGLGKLLREFAGVFATKKIVAIDPSIECVNKLRTAKWISKYNIAIHHASLYDFDSIYLQDNPLDLSICNSVFQYITENKVEFIFRKLSRITRYLYFCAPTTNDYRMMEEEVGFVDPYAFSRSREFYRDAWAAHFRSVSLNLLESIELVQPSEFVFDLFQY